MNATRPQLQNLIPFEAGQSGNPAGRPKNAPVVTPRLRYYSSWSLSRLVTLLAEHEDQLPIADIIAIGTLLKAGKEVAWGDKAREMVINRLDGVQSGSSAIHVESEHAQIVIVRNTPELGV